VTVVAQDRYRNFAELAAQEAEWRDFRRLLRQRPSPLAIIAPHGGGIEQGTSEIAAALAGEEFSLYAFEGLKSRRNDDLHLTSTHFDDPLCLQLLERTETVVAVHGCAGEEAVVYLGGLARQLEAALLEALRGAGLRVEENAVNLSGRYANNICNRGRAKEGVQLELSEGLRRAMFQGLDRRDRWVTKPTFASFVAAARAVLLPAFGSGGAA
jgi:phage replication-related protein YjqB (UPF0714/DUF867 family)